VHRSSGPASWQVLALCSSNAADYMLVQLHLSIYYTLSHDSHDKVSPIVHGAPRWLLLGARFAWVNISFIW
jgi:hypothetical protein